MQPAPASLPRSLHLPTARSASFAVKIPAIPALLACALLPGSPAAANEGDPGVADIGSRLELFTDRHLVERLENLEFRLHEPRREPLAASPITGGYMTVIHDGDLYRAYYRDIDRTYEGRMDYSGHPGEFTRYAESDDGHEWRFPVLGLHEVAGSRENNVILAGLPPFSHNFAPFLDTRPDADPEERFKALAGHPGYERATDPKGLHAFVSADGIHWRMKPEEAVIPYRPGWTHAFDSQNVAFWSEAEGCYVSYFRTWAPYSETLDPTKTGESGTAANLVETGEAVPREAGSARSLRGISRSTSPDFVNWTEPVPLPANRPGEHLYTNQTHPYFRAPHLYVALPSRYTAGRLGEERAHGMRGSTDILFMTTRAGSSQYDRLFTEAFIRPGPDPERWENRANYVAQNVVPTGPMEMSIYHSRSGHRYTLRTDGFVSLRAGAERGEMVTKPFRFSGDTLLLNLSTSAAGELAVELQDKEGRPIPGFSLEESRVLLGDEIDKEAAWEGEPDLGALAGRAVRLRVVMMEADLYSFRFGTRGQQPVNREP